MEAKQKEQPKIQLPDQNTLAYLLNTELNKEVTRFMRNHRGVTINAIMGAAHLFLTSWLIHAPKKEQALQALEESIQIMRKFIEDTPDSMFGQKKSHK